MKFATVRHQGESCFALSLHAKSSKWILWRDYAKIFHQDKVILQTKTLLDFIKQSDVLTPHFKKNEAIWSALPSYEFTTADTLLPFQPVGFRDFYCFEEHVMTARKGRGLEMVSEWYQAPIFYYSNPLNFRGPVDIIPYPREVEELDLELEIACVIGREIRDATFQAARDAIFGFTLLNDWSARDVQRFEMKCNLGPAKAKDFATSLGSFIISRDELEPHRSGKGYDIDIEAHINGARLTRKNWRDIQFSFEEMLMRASKNCTIYPGEVIASGTMGGGCLLEYNITSGENRWLKKGDQVVMTWVPDGPSLANKIGSSE